MRYLPVKFPGQRGSLWRRCLPCALLAFAGATYADSDPTRFSLEELLKLTIDSGAKYAQGQSEVAAAASVITREEIEVFGWRTLAEALASLPGMHVTYDRQYHYLGTRGLGLPGDYNTRMLIMINGQRLNDTVYDQGPVGWDFPLDMNLVERIEYIPGPNSALYGQNAMLGVVNVVTRQGHTVDGTQVQVDWQVPQRASQTHLMFGRKLDNGLDLLLAASGENSRGQDLQLDFGRAGAPAWALALDGESVRRVFASLSSDQWRVNVLQGDRIKNDPTASFGSMPLVAGQYSGDHYALANVEYRQQFWDGNLDFTGRLFAGSYRFDTWLMSVDGSPLDMSSVGEWQGTELRWLATGIPNHKIILGLEHQQNPRVDQYMRYAQPARNVSIQSSGHLTGVYLQDECKLTADLTAIYGLRWDTRSDAESHISPSGGLIWQPDPDSTVKGLWGRAYRAPNAYERTSEGGLPGLDNPMLRGERINTLELVADHRLNHQTQVRASIYHWRLDDMIVLGNDVSALARYQNGQPLSAQGLELSLDRTWQDGSRLRGSWSLQQSAYSDGQALLNSPSRLFKLLISRPMALIGAQVGYETYYDSSRLTLAGDRLGGYRIANLVLRWDQAVKNWEFSAGINNVFDKHYAQPASDSNWQNALVQDGRSLRVQASYRFH